jgi:hypothetical protein
MASGFGGVRIRSLLNCRIRPNCSGSATHLPQHQHAILGFYVTSLVLQEPL